MLKHLRTASWDHPAFRDEMPVTLGPSSSLFNPRLSMPDGPYYTEMAAPPPPPPPPPHHLDQDGPDSDYPPFEDTAPPVSHPSSMNPQRASSGAWTKKDDGILQLKRIEGLNWAQIQSGYFPNKTPNACRKRHERLMERKNQGDTSGEEEERIAKSFMESRKQIWDIIAKKTGMKWTLVEDTVMSKGLKNLQALARAANRRERLAAAAAAAAATQPMHDNGIEYHMGDESDGRYSNQEDGQMQHGGVDDDPGHGLPSVNALQYSRRDRLAAAAAAAAAANQSSHDGGIEYSVGDEPGGRYNSSDDGQMQHDGVDDDSGHGLPSVSAASLQSYPRSLGRRERLVAGHQPPHDGDSGLTGMEYSVADEQDGRYSGLVDGGPINHRAAGDNPGQGLPSVSAHYSDAGGHLHPVQPYYGASAGHYGSSAGSHGHSGHGHHGYTSSVSSINTAASYDMAHSRSHSTTNEDSPYDHQRLPSVDMGIDAIINRPMGSGL